MVRVVRQVSKITEKGQTTVPKSVRQALGIDYGGRIAFSIDENQRVSIERDDGDVEDPVIESFLDFLSADMQSNPGRSIAEFPANLRARMQSLTKGMSVDPDAPIDGEVDL